MAYNESFLAIIEQAEAMFRVKGYHSTSIADIAKACGLNKSSIYHHVSSKKDLAFKVVQHVHERFKQQVINTVYDEQSNAEALLAEFLIHTENYFASRKGGCLVANLVLEMAAHDSDFNHVFQPFFNDWSGALEHVISHLVSPMAAKRIALESLAFFQGLLMLEQVYLELSSELNIAKRVQGQISNALKSETFTANT